MVKKVSSLRTRCAGMGLYHHGICISPIHCSPTYPISCFPTGNRLTLAKILASLHILRICRGSGIKSCACTCT